MADRPGWLTALARITDRSGDPQGVPCPRCGRDELALRYVVDPDSRVGYVLFWCGACLHGISVSRARAPEGVPVRHFDDPAATEGVPDFIRED
ncbi:MAG: hypothetical protein FWE15_17670 [Actinomycetia bacterium]|nr:hypothetical protein [Actinomycetes bacterium]